jgi:hypothetical protein
MVEVLDKLGQLAKERADLLNRTSKALEGQAEGLVVVVKEGGHFVAFLYLIWNVMHVRFRKGGVPAKRLLQECDLLLTLADGVRQQLAGVNKVLQERVYPSEVAQPIYKEIQTTELSLDSLVREIRYIRERAATPPRVGADPEQLKQRIRQADEGKEWLKLADVVSRMQQDGSPKQE